MQIATGSITFSPVSGLGPRTATQDVTFAAPVTVATAILTGMNVEYSHHDDHHLGNLQVGVSGAPLDSQTVRVTATYGLRDWSGNWDDDYAGQVFFAVIAE
jgi:hypothetical protein